MTKRVVMFGIAMVIGITGMVVLQPHVSWITEVIGVTLVLIAGGFICLAVSD